MALKKMKRKDEWIYFFNQFLFSGTIELYLHLLFFKIKLFLTEQNIIFEHVIFGAKIQIQFFFGK